MEVAISSQFINLTRWLVAFIVIYLVLPVFIVPVTGDTLLERFFSRYVRMVALTICLGYILVALKLYEMLSLSFMFIILIILLKVPAKYRRSAFREISTNFSLWIYDVLDGLIHPYQLFRQWLAQTLAKIKTEIIKFANLTNSIQALLLLAVLAYSAYLRFYDALHHAAPAMSDAYVTLAWMKYIDGRVLFHDGIYPQGFHIYLSILHKFAACDALYILKYTGPLNGVLTTLGIYLFIVKLTGRKLPGIISAFVFGVIGGILPLEWVRQASTNSQEFALVFLLPAWYYALAFLQTRKKHYLWTAAAAFAVIALVHTLILVFLWVGLACLVGAYLLLRFRETLRSAGQLITAGIVTGVVAALPVPIALLAGMKFNSASVEFLKQTIHTGIPILTLIDIMSLIGFGLFFLITVGRRKAGTNPAMALFIFSVGVASFLMYLLVGPVTGNALLVTRLGILWSLLAAVGVGLGVDAFFQMIPGNQNSLKSIISALMALVLMAGAVTYYKPSPAQPYKMQYDAEINQYLRISEKFTNSAWTLVSGGDEGYDLALGKGWNINLRDFMTWYDPQKSKLVRMVDGKAIPLESEDLFIFYQKKLFVVDIKEMEPILPQRERDFAALKQWVAKYRENHDNLSVYYQDDFIEIYHIHQPKPKEEIFKQIWGQGN